MADLKMNDENIKWWRPTDVSAERLHIQPMGGSTLLQATELAAMERGHAALEAQAAKLEEVGESPEALFNYMQNAGIDPAKIAELGGEPREVLDDALRADLSSGAAVASMAALGARRGRGRAPRPRPSRIPARCFALAIFSSISIS